MQETISQSNLEDPTEVTRLLNPVKAACLVLQEPALRHRADKEDNNWKRTLLF